MGYLDALKLGEAQWGVVCDLAEGFSGSDASEADAFLDRGRAARLLEERVWPLQKQLGVDLATVGIGSALPKFNNSEKLRSRNKTRKKPARRRGAGGGPAARTRRRRRRGTWPPAGNYRVTTPSTRPRRRPREGARLTRKGRSRAPSEKCFVRALYALKLPRLSSSPPISKRKGRRAARSPQQPVDRQRDGLAARRPE